MAARKKKQGRDGSGFGNVLMVLAVCVGLGAAGLGYVWQKNQNFEIGQRIKEQELRLKTLQQTNQLLRDRLIELRSPQYLRQAVEERGMKLDLPDPEQILRLKEPEIGQTQITDPIVSYGARIETLRDGRD